MSDWDIAVQSDCRKCFTDAGRHTIYSSKESRTVREVDADEMPTPSKPAFIRRVIDRLGL